MTSARGALGSGAILMAVPAAALCQALAGAGAELAVHAFLALGAALLALAVFDFGAPRWANRAGSACAAVLAAIFALQTASELSGDEGLARLGYQVLGQWLEGRLGDGFLAWCAVLLLTDRRASRIVGAVALAPAVAARVLAAIDPGGAQAMMLKPLVLLPFAWLMFESVRSREAAPRRADLTPPAA